ITVTNYEWQVQTNCGSANLSAFSNSSTFSTSAPLCSVPTGLSTTGITATNAMLNWTAVTGAAGYKIQYRQVASSSWVSLASAANAVSVSSLTSSTNYEWEVQADCGNSNFSALSAPVSFST